MDKEPNKTELEYRYSDADFNLVFMDGFDAAIIGVDEESGKVIYSRSKCIELMMCEDEMDWEEAADSFSYNQVRSNLYLSNPVIIMHDLEDSI